MNGDAYWRNLIESLSLDALKLKDAEVYALLISNEYSHGQNLSPFPFPPLLTQTNYFKNKGGSCQTTSTTVLV